LRRLVRRVRNRHLWQDWNAPPQPPVERGTRGGSRVPSERISRGLIENLGDPGGGSTQSGPPDPRRVPSSKVDRQKRAGGGGRR
jgi:hypothetical protein